MRKFLLVSPDEAAFEAGLAAAPDVVVLDLVGNPTSHPLFAGGERRAGAAIYALVSPLRSVAIDEDLGRAMQLGAAGIVLSGAEGLTDMERLGARLAVLEAEHGREDGAIRIVALVDDAQGALSLSTMRPRPRLEAIAVDPAALATRLGCAPDAPAVSQASGLTVLAAAACGVSAAVVLGGDHPRELAAASDAGFGTVILRP